MKKTKPSSKNRLFTLLMILFISFISIPNAYALSCMRSGPLSLVRDVTKAQFVFEGYVQEVGPPKEVEPYLEETESGEMRFLRMPTMEDNYPDAKPYRVEVSKVWRGEVANEVTVYGGGLWQHDIEVGQSYFFLINTKGEDGFYLGSCSPSTYSIFQGRFLLFSGQGLILIGIFMSVGLGVLIWKRKKK